MFAPFAKLNYPKRIRFMSRFDLPFGSTVSLTSEEKTLQFQKMNSFKAKE